MTDKADLNKLLIDAVEHGDPAKVYRAVEMGADPACITPAHIPPHSVHRSRRGIRKSSSAC